MLKLVLSIYAAGMVAGLAIVTQAEESISPAQDTKNEIVPPSPLAPLPTPDQLQWHEDDLTLFVHFTVGTFTGMGTGHGGEDPNIFQPKKMDCSQWARTAKETGFKGILLTAKHHDGFCLWQTETTDHSVKASTWRGGKGDVVRDLADACKKEGVKMGLYCSPWDRNRHDYETDKKAYTVFYLKQLTELLTNYGDIYEMWFDGNRAKIHDWESIIELVRQLQPHAVIKQGPKTKPIMEDVRWVGNEEALAPKENWCVYPPPTQNSKASRIWFPKEADPKTLSSWFWVDEPPTPLAKMLDYYYVSVGRGSILLFNVPPNPDGLFSDAWVTRLHQFRDALKSIFSKNIAVAGTATADNVRGDSAAYQASAVLDGDPQTYWTTDDDKTTASLTVAWDKEVEFNVIRIEEMISLGQRVSKYKVEIWNSSKADWDTVSSQTTIGRRKLDRIPLCRTSKVRLTILESRACPVIREFGVHLDTVSPAKHFEPGFANREHQRKRRRKK